jgi:hypothetical protein
MYLSIRRLGLLIHNQSLANTSQFAKNPMPVPNPEQTASLISRMTYTYLDSLIYAATKVAHLSYAQLPPLADDDSSSYQSSQAFPVRIHSSSD